MLKPTHNSTLGSQAAAVLLAAGAIVASACASKPVRQVRIFTPPVIAKVVPPVVQPILLDPPEFVLAPTVPEAGVVIPLSAILIAPPPPPPRRTTTPAKPAVAQIPEPVAPKAFQLFTDEEKRTYRETLDNHLDRVRKDLDILARKTLTKDQTASLEQVRSFVRQAEQAREQDLVTAVNLARRADFLAEDLVGRLP